MELSKRKPNRLEKFDYSSGGYYFITICTLERKKILCDLVGGGAYDAPKTVFTKAGRIVEKYILSSNKIENVRVEKYVIMPNHIHLLLFVDDFYGTSRAPSPTNRKIPHYVGTLKRFCNKEIGDNIFQRSYHDHIIRNETDYRKIYEYIESNPSKWQEDSYYG